ncbi:MAG: sugar phosphate isomerase/epimerase [Clostridia bacterium]|nr:sugar phosphate isomerase/epimerase [Clostridia bacterium]
MSMSAAGYCFGMPFLLETASIEDAIALACRLDLRFVELNSNFPQCQLSLMDPAWLRAEAARTGLFFTLHLDDSLNVCDFNLAVRAAYVSTVLDAIALAKAADIPVINIHLAKGNIVTLPDGKHYIFANFRDAFEEALLAFRQQCEEAIADSGVRICVENTDGWEDYERRGIEILLESPVFGLTLDIGHNHAVDDLDLPFFEMHRDRLCHMHAHDGWAQTNHQAMGSGEIPLHDRLDLARACDATVVLETKTIDALEASTAWLKTKPELQP